MQRIAGNVKTLSTAIEDVNHRHSYSEAVLRVGESSILVLKIEGGELNTTPMVA